MFDPKQAGEEADAMIKGLNQPAQEVENQTEADIEAIAQTGEEAESGQPPIVEGSQPETPAVETPADEKLDKLMSELSAANQRWKVLQGMIEKKDGEIETLRAMLAQLANKEAAPAASEPAQIASAVTADEIREYGADYIDLIRRLAREVFHSEFNGESAKLQERFGNIEKSVSSVQEVTTKTAQERFLDSLTSKVGDWQELNTDAGFLTWLEGVDPLSGSKRLNLLRDAYAAMDARRTASFFELYKAEAGLVQAAAQPAAPDENKLVKLVSPGKSKSVTPKQEAQGHVWTRDEIAKLYDDKMANRIGQKEFAERERDLFRAQREGRVAA